MRKLRKLILAILLVITLLPINSCDNTPATKVYSGYAEKELIPTEDMKPLYIAGYKQGKEIEGVLDYQKVKAMYIDYYGQELLMISIDCVGLTSNYVNKIRKEINKEFKHLLINVASTHTHAGIDTMGLWGPIAMDGKSDVFMDLLVNEAVKVGKRAIYSSIEGHLTYGKIETQGILEDSRNPQVYDSNMYQIRFVPKDNFSATRMIFYGAHAESLRGDNNLLSADFPAQMAEVIKERTNDNCLYFNGAIGGLIMTKVFDHNDLVNNMRITGNKLAEYALSIKETKLENKTLKQNRVKVVVELDNTLFKYYKFLGILGNDCYKNIFTNKYYLKTEVSVLQISNVTFVLLPGEIFPELVYGGSLINPESNKENPRTIIDIASDYNIENLVVIGLCNDEIGYIVPPSDFLVNEEYPYVQNRLDQYGENHYEETNSVGENVAYTIIEALEKAFEKL